MAEFSPEELELRQRFKTDFPLYSERCLKIRSKVGDVQPFRLNRSQRFLHERLEKQLATKGKVRALVLKGRQVGISTYISGRQYWRVSHNFGRRGFVLTHLDTASDNLFGLIKRFHENCPAVLRPQTKASNAKELSFGALDSGYKVATAGSAEVGRSETLQLFHGSEVAFWPNAEKHAAGVRQAIASVPGTEVIFESTANGIGNVFHREWKTAERGDSDFEAIFIPWYWHEEYSEPFPHDWQAPPAFREYRTTYGLTPEQLYWAWKKNRELAVTGEGGSDEICWRFRQEYPANADEAFQTGGIGSFIPAEAILRARKANVAGYGPVILGVDPACGGGDKTGIVDRQGRRLGGNICKRIDSKDLMATAGWIQQEVKRLMGISQDIKVVIDTTGLGGGLYDRLKELLGDMAEGVNFGSGAHEPERYANRRAEMWDGMRHWFLDAAGAGVQIPDSDELHSDLAAPTTEGTIPGGTRFNSSGQLVLEAKDHMRTRLSFSPDLGDAAALTFAVDLSMAAQPVADYWVPQQSPGGWLAA